MASSPLSRCVKADHWESRLSRSGSAEMTRASNAAPATPRNRDHADMWICFRTARRSAAKGLRFADKL
jgi:hypothetical protein